MEAVKMYVPELGPPKKSAAVPLMFTGITPTRIRRITVPASVQRMHQATYWRPSAQRVHTDGQPACVSYFPK